MSINPIPAGTPSGEPQASSSKLQKPEELKEFHHLQKDSPASTLISRINMCLGKLFHLPSYFYHLPQSLYKGLSSSFITAPLWCVYHHLFGTQTAIPAGTLDGERLKPSGSFIEGFPAGHGDDSGGSGGKICSESKNGTSLIGSTLADCNPAEISGTQKDKIDEGDDSTEFEEDSETDDLIGHSTMTNTEHSCYSSSLFSMAMLIDEIQKILSLNPKNPEMINRKCSETPQTPDEKSEPSEISLQDSKKEYVSKSLVGKRVGRKVTKAVKDRMLELIHIFEEEHHEQDLLEVLEPFLSYLQKILVDSESGDMKEDMIDNRLTIPLPKKKDENSGQWGLFEDRPAQLGAILGSESDKKIIPGEDCTNLILWMKSFLKPSSSVDKNNETEQIISQFSKAPPFLAVQVHRGTKLKSISNGEAVPIEINELPFITPRAITFHKGVEYLDGEYQILYRRVGCAVYRGDGLNGHYKAYLEKSNGDVYLHDDCLPEPKRINRGTYDYKEYTNLRDNYGRLFFYKKTRLKNSAI